MVVTRELVSEEGLRADGRRPKEVRRIQTQIGIMNRMDGSCRYEQGYTHVIASIQGPKECKFRSKALHDRAVVNCEYKVSSFATLERREVSKSNWANRELALSIKETFEAIILTELFPHSEINIFIDVIEADGDVLCAAINATSLALINAGIPLKSFVTACTAGMHGDDTVLDLNHVERQLGGGTVSIAIRPDNGDICMLRMEGRLSMDHTEKIIAMATIGCHTIHTTVKDKLQEYSLSLMNQRGVLTS